MVSRTINVNQISKVFRKQHIEWGVLGLKTLCIVLCISLLGFALGDFIEGRLRVSKSRSALEGSVTQLLQNPPSAGNEKNKVRKDYTVITTKNILGQVGQLPTPTPLPKPVSKVPLSLIGTFISKKEPPSAIIEDQRKQVQDVFNVNDTIFGEAKLVAVYRDKVEIERAGSIEILKLDEGTKGPGRGGSSSSPAAGVEELVVDEAELDAALSNLPLLLTQVRAVPYFKDGQAIGLRLFAIRAGSLFEKIGLKNGDILKSINDNNLGDFSQAIKLFEKLKEERSIKVMLERNREEREFRYTIR